MRRFHAGPLSVVQQTFNTFRKWTAKGRVQSFCYRQQPAKCSHEGYKHNSLLRVLQQTGARVTLRTMTIAAMVSTSRKIFTTERFGVVAVASCGSKRALG